MPSFKQALLQQLKALRGRLRYIAQWRTPLPVYEYRGRLRQSEQEVCLIFIGSSQLLSEAFFTHEPQRRQLAQVTAWSASTYLRTLLKQRGARNEVAIDLALLPHLPWQAVPPSDLLLPDYLEARIPFPASYSDWLTQLRDNTRRSVQQAQKLGVTFRRASCEADYAYFHQHLLTPYMQARHGYNCYVEPLAEFCADTRHAVLELLELQGEIVAGFHLKMPAHADATYFNKVGLSPASFADKTRMRLLNSLIYARMAELSLAAGYTGMELGITPAIMAHGILWYKAGWGAEFRANQNHQRYCLSLCSERASSLLAAIPALITLKRGDQLSASGWYLADADQAQIAQQGAELEKFRFAGLSDIQLNCARPVTSAHDTAEP